MDSMSIYCPLRILRGDSGGRDAALLARGGPQDPDRTDDRRATAVGSWDQSEICVVRKGEAAAAAKRSVCKVRAALGWRFVGINGRCVSRAKVCGFDPCEVRTQR